MKNETEILRRLEVINTTVDKLIADRFSTRANEETWRWIIHDLGDELIKIGVEADVIGFLIKGENK